MTFSKLYCEISAASAQSLSHGITAETFNPKSFAILCDAAIASSETLFRTQFLCSMNTKMLIITLLFVRCSRVSRLLQFRTKQREQLTRERLSNYANLRFEFFD